MRRISKLVSKAVLSKLWLFQARLTDSNKNLVARALGIFGELAKAMGPAWERVGRPVLQQVATFLGDNKKQVKH